MITIKYLSVMKENFPITVSVQSLRHFDFSHRIRWPKICNEKVDSVRVCTCHIVQRNDLSQKIGTQFQRPGWRTQPAGRKWKWWFNSFGDGGPCLGGFGLCLLLLLVQSSRRTMRLTQLYFLKIFLWPLYLCVDNHNRKIQCKQHSGTPNKEQQDKNARWSISMKILKKISNQAPHWRHHHGGLLDTKISK